MKTLLRITKMNRRALFLLFLIAMLAAGIKFTPHSLARAQSLPTPAGDFPVTIYFFWGDGCPHCAAAKPFLEELSRQPNVELRSYEVWHNLENREIFWSMAIKFGFEPSGVPTIFIGERYWVGYSEPLRDEILAVVAFCAQSGCRDAQTGKFPPTPMPTPVPTQAATSAPTLPATAENIPAPQQDAGRILSLPLVGAVDLSAHSLTFSTALIAFVDGFNPCSLWVLSILLALTLHNGSRKKVFLVGIVFLTVTSMIYALFILGLFTMFTVISFVGWIQIAVALVALFFAAVNIKDYFWYKEGLSFTIADEKKPGIYKRMRRVLDAGDSTWGLISATIILAAGVSLVEFSCTAGFPVLWTNLLITQNADAFTFGWLLLLYMFIYQVDELGIFFVAVFTLKASKLEEKYGRILKLVGGMLMLTLAAVMIFNPAWMNQVNSSLLVFLAAFGLTALVLTLHRYVLPRFGIYIGTEFTPPHKTSKTSK